jgi:hypothetical protein
MYYFNDIAGINQEQIAPKIRGFVIAGPIASSYKAGNRRGECFDRVLDCAYAVAKAMADKCSNALNEFNKLLNLGLLTLRSCPQGETRSSTDERGYCTKFLGKVKRKVATDFTDGTEYAGNFGVEKGCGLGNIVVKRRVVLQ